MNRYRKLRIAVALLFGVGLTLLFLDFSGLAHRYLGWMAELQLLPALLALNAVVVSVMLLLTLLFGRLYCSIICPLGVMQDVVARFGRMAKRNRYGFSKAKNLLRIVVLVLFVAGLLVGLTSLVGLVAPYSAFGRIATNLLQPLWVGANNLLAMAAERMDSYAFYRVEVVWRGAISLAVAVATLLVVGWLAWRNGRTWCNTICPVGTMLGFFARFSWLRPVIDRSKCNGCGLCARNCKAASINPKEHTIDMSRCVVCFDCIDSCRQGAIRYLPRTAEHSTKSHSDNTKGGGDHAVSPENKTNGPAAGVSRRSFLTLAGLFAATSVVQAKRKKVDGGVAVLLEKQAPRRKMELVPAGAQSLRHLAQHCTACQLCISACPNGVLRPADGVMRLMQPTMSFERGYCRPECTRCSEVCPTDAIRLVTREVKSSISIGHAVWVADNCLAASEGVKCDNCARHCPSQAITMVQTEGYERPIPVVDAEHCIGCGACEHLCPARPFSALYVEGNDTHRTL